MAEKIPLKVSYDPQGVPIGIAEFSATDTIPPAHVTGYAASLAFKEDVANKSASAALGTSDVLYPTQAAVKSYVDSAVVGLLDDRGNYDASVNTFPAAGGSGAAGAILKGDVWYISVTGTLGGVAVAAGSAVRALVNTPAQTAGNWSIMAGTGDIAGLIHAAPGKTTPVDADEMGLWDSVALSLKKLTWANLKATLFATANTWSAVQTHTANVVVPSLNGGQLAGNRNILVNGDFTINQRAYASAAALAAGSYGHDRWKAGAGGGNYSFTQLKNSTTLTIATGKTLIQVVEDKNVVGGSYVLSWAGTAQGRYAINSATPAGAYAASPILITGQTAGTVMSVEFNEGTLGTVQLELGSAATSFEHRLNELQLCQRYYTRLTVATAYGTFGVGMAISTTSGYAHVALPVMMRVTPSLGTGGTPAVLTAVPAHNNATFGLSHCTFTGARIDISGSSGLTAGQAILIESNSDINTYLEFLAEL